MRVLVTGGAGFIGSHVCAQLLDHGHEVVVLDALLEAVHPGGRDAVVLDERATLFVGDVRDRSTVEHALRGIDAVCHQAAMVGLGVDLRDLPAYAGINDLGTAVLLASMAAARITRLVLASSMVVYGEGRYVCPAHGDVRPGIRYETSLAAGLFEPPCPVCGRPLSPGLVDESAPLEPRNVYAATKTAQEHLAAAWADGAGATVAALRYHNVYGPRMPKDTPYAGVASIFRSSLARGEAPRVFEDGGQRRDFVHVTDVATANRLAVEADPAAGLRAYNIGSGTPHTVGEMAGVLAAAAGGAEPVITGQWRVGDVRHVTASSERAMNELGYAPAVSFADGVAAFAHEPLRD